MPSTRFLHSLQSIPATDWDALHDGQNPFISHAFLSGLEEHGCLREDWGWQPRHFTLWRAPDRRNSGLPEDQLPTANSCSITPGPMPMPAMAATTTRSGWARCRTRRSPAPAGPSRFRAHYAAVGVARCTAALEVSSAHINFHTAADEALFGDDWLLREDVQFQWQNPGDWATFDQFLGAMNHKHRKNIRQERAKVARQGITFRVVHGDDASRADLQAMYRFYLQTFLEYGNAPALTEPFLRHLAISLGRGLVLFLAEQEGQPIAALCLRGGDTRTAATGAAPPCPACTSKPVTTRASSTACAKA